VFLKTLRENIDLSLLRKVITMMHSEARQRCKDILKNGEESDPRYSNLLTFCNEMNEKEEEDSDNNESND
jgi:hypothetical protein